VFAISIFFHPILIFAGKAGAYHSGVPLGTPHQWKILCLAHIFLPIVEINSNGKHFKL
jgi:hypothetical protein